MRSPVAAIVLAGCWHAPAAPPPPKPPPVPVVEEPALPKDAAECSASGVMPSPASDPKPERLNPKVPGETIKLVTCRFPPEPYTPKLEDSGQADDNDAYWHSFSSWKAYLVRHGAHPYVWESDIGVGQFHEGYADASLAGVVATPVPLVVIRHESGGMGMHSTEMRVYRADSPPTLVASYSDDTIEIEMTPTGFTLERCFLDGDQSLQAMSCIEQFPDQIETTTYTWNGRDLTATATTPPKTPRPK